MLANKYNVPVLKNNPCVSRLHYYVYSKHYHKNVRSGFLNYLKDRLSLIYRLRKLNFDLLVIPNGGMNKNAIAFARQLNVADCRWHTAETEFDDRVKAHAETRPVIHEALAGFSLLPELAPPNPEEFRPQLFPCSTRVRYWQQTLGRAFKPRIGFFVSNNCAERLWPTEKWQTLVNKLVRRYEIVIFQTSQDTRFSEWQGARVISPRCAADPIAAMTQLTLVISADSAPVDISSALQIPLIALFQSMQQKYRRWYPPGVRHILLHEGQTVSNISVESVAAAVIKISDGNNKYVGGDETARKGDLQSFPENDDKRSLYI